VHEGERIIPHIPGLRRYARLLERSPRADDLVGRAAARLRK
jgi:hypothetical protein